MSDNADVGSVNPTSLSHLIGQRQVVENVRVALDAAHMDGRRFDHTLLVGGPGLGKTQVAKVIAAEMAGDLHEVLGQTLVSNLELNHLLLAAKDKDIVFIDEAALIPSEQQHALLIALDQRKVYAGGGRSGKPPQAVPLADITVLMATTDEYRLIQPLRDRMRLVLRFDFYRPDEVAELTRQRCRGLGWPVEGRVLPEIAIRSRGTPRLALRLLQSARRVCRSEGEDTITAAHLKRACDLEQIDPLGLGPVEQRYISLLTDGATRLNVLASRLGLPARTVAEVTEPFLIRVGLVGKDGQGRRELTAAGRSHLLSDAGLRESFGDIS